MLLRPFSMGWMLVALNVECRTFAMLLGVVMWMIYGHHTSAEEPSSEVTSVVVLVGAGGAPEYVETFLQTAAKWQKATAAGGAEVTTVGESGEADSLQKFRAALTVEGPKSSGPLWLVLVGHGSGTGADAKFNLSGDDLAATELAALLRPVGRPLVVICTFSASGAFLAPLAAPGRIVLAATKSGAENNYSRLGEHLAETISDLAADLDHDGQTSLLESWLSAGRRVADFYQNEGRLATEHSMLDDNADGRGTPADWFQGLKLVKKVQGFSEADGLRAHQLHLVPSATERALPPELRRRRDALELEVAKLRDAKATLEEADYYTQLETLLLQLAEVYRPATPRVLPATR